MLPTMSESLIARLREEERMRCHKQDRKKIELDRKKTELDTEKTKWAPQLQGRTTGFC